MHPVPVYSLSPRQIVDAMFIKHGQTTGPDLQKLRDPLLKLLPALAELEIHMNLFMLASVKLTASGHGENPYRYFEMFLESVKGFPVLRQQLPGFFTMYPTVNQQNVTVLFAFLRPLITHMMAECSSSPFSGAATAPPKTAPNRRQKQRKTPKGRKHDWNTWTNSGQPAFPPHFAGASSKPKHHLLSLARIARRRMWQSCSDVTRRWPSPHLQSTFLPLLAIPGTKMALRPMAPLVLVRANFIVGCTAGTTAITAHNVA